MENEQNQAALDIDKMLLTDVLNLHQRIKEGKITNKEVKSMSGLVSYIARLNGDFTKVDIDTNKEKELTLGDLLKYYDMARINYIIVHRTNYIVYQSILDLQDIMGKRYKFQVKRFGEKAINVYEDYRNVIRKHTDEVSFGVLQDCLRLTDDILKPKINAVFAAIRDKMISLGWKDIEVKARLETSLILFRMAVHTRLGFFQDFYENTGMDFTRAFGYANIWMMGEYLAKMADAYGIKVEKKENGNLDVEGYDFINAVRVKWAWDNFIADIRDNELMDAVATKAIDENPLAADDYEKELQKSKEREMQNKINELGDKFKVTKKK